MSTNQKSKLKYTAGGFLPENHSHLKAKSNFSSLLRFTCQLVESKKGISRAQITPAVLHN